MIPPAPVEVRAHPADVLLEMAYVGDETDDDGPLHVWQNVRPLPADTTGISCRELPGRTTLRLTLEGIQAKRRRRRWWPA